MASDRSTITMTAGKAVPVTAKGAATCDRVVWSRGEPRLADLLADPMLRLLMQRDGVGESDIRGLAAFVPTRPV